MGMLGRLSTCLIEILLLNQEMFESALRPMDSHLLFKGHHHAHASPPLLFHTTFQFLCLIILGLDHPEKKLNVMLKPLIEELKDI
jgi:hypothetical protein